ncbi:MAG: hypothetical protein H7832_02545 [Magnetococcus sp. DMHC-6]
MVIIVLVFYKEERTWSITQVIEDIQQGVPIAKSKKMSVSVQNSVTQASSEQGESKGQQSVETADVYENEGWRQEVDQIKQEVVDIPKETRDVVNEATTLSENQLWLQSLEGVTDPVVVGYPKIGKSLLNKKRLFAKIFNNSDQSLILAFVKVTFFGKDGQIVYEKIVQPLVFSGGLFGDQVSHLPPGKIRQFGMDVEDISREWTGEVTFKLLEYRFGLLS